MRSTSRSTCAHVLADRRADLDDRLVHLALDLVAERRRSRREQLADVRAQLPRGGVDDLELFLDADGEPVGHRHVPGRCRGSRTGGLNDTVDSSIMFDQGAGTSPATGNLVGHIRVIHGVRSPQLGNTRDVHVYLPPSYRTSGRHYPVIYMHDGQNLFDPATSFAGEWHVDETMERLVAAGHRGHHRRRPEHGSRPGLRIQSLARAQGRRRWRRRVSRVPRRHAEAQDRQHYCGRAASGTHTGILGSSMGGLISLYAFFRRPDVFGFCGAMSPSLWFARGAIASVVGDIERWFGRLYLDIGTGEGQRHVKATRQLYRHLRRKCPYPRDQILCVVDEGAGHSEHAWSQRFETAVRFLLPRAPRRNQLVRTVCGLRSSVYGLRSNYGLRLRVTDVPSARDQLTHDRRTHPGAAATHETAIGDATSARSARFIRHFPRNSCSRRAASARALARLTSSRLDRRGRSQFGAPEREAQTIAGHRIDESGRIADRQQARHTRARGVHGQRTDHDGCAPSGPPETISEHWIASQRIDQ